MNNILIAVLILVILGGGWWAFNQDPAPVSTSGDVNIFSDATSSEVTENASETPDTTNENPELPVSTDKVLNLSNQGLTSVPQSVFSNKNVTELNLANNALSGALPGEVRFLENLTVLNLSNNQFTGVPAEIGQLKNLEVLDLSNNEITGLPNELGNLRNLKILKLTGNQYSSADLEGIKKNLPSSVVIETN
jgi:Leucine-rich repeat (LRR) protein